MKKEIVYICGVSLLFSVQAYAGLEKNKNNTCAALGYNTTVSDCLTEGGTPLVCPISSADEQMCVCMIESCRGYFLTNEDLDALASDGKTYREHTEEISECVVGFGEDEKTFYRVDRCKEGSLYQNGVCDVGCDKVNKYPYTVHPGNLAGEVKNCLDASGEYFGYDNCNDGWVLSAGRCNLATCKIVEYPYAFNPNIPYYRGQTLSCRIGGNLYYKYTSVDKDKNTLTEDTCTLNGYTHNRGACSANCEIDIDNCTYEERDGYKDWHCPLKDAVKCRVGDKATIGGKSIGIIVHLSDVKTVVMANENAGPYKMTDTYLWAAGGAQSADIPTMTHMSWTDGMNDFNGKKNTSQIIKFGQDKGFSYPAAETCYQYTPKGCSHAMCAAKEWYFPALGEMLYIYDNRYVLYNVIGDANLYSSVYHSASTHGPYSASLTCINFNSKYMANNGKYQSYYVRPYLAF